MAPRLQYFVPQGHEDALRKAELSFTPAIAETADRDGPPFRLPGFIITSGEKRATRALDALDLKAFIECRVGNQLYHLVVGSTESEALTSAAYSRKNESDVAWTFMQDYLVNAVMDFSSWITRPVDLRIMKGEIVNPVHGTGRMLVVVNGRPPGEPIEVIHEKLCEVTLGGLEYTTEYSAGIGEVVRYKDTIIGQIVGDTLYVFLDLSDPMLFVVGIRGANVRLFERMLAVVWNQYLARIPPAPPVSSSSAELSSAVITWTDDVYRGSEAIIDARKQELLAAEEAYRDAMLSYRVSLAALSATQSFRDRTVEYLGTTEDQQRAWDELAADPLVSSIAIVDKGINLTTTPIVFAHDGKRHPLGSFVLRLTFKGHLYIWCLNSPHPKQVPHPHVGATGELCFGNAALTVAHLADIERNFPKVFRLTLELLTDGYDETTTRHPIREWPEEKAYESDHEPLPPGRALRSGTGSSRDADRRGLGGKLGSVPACEGGSD